MQSAADDAPRAHWEVSNRGASAGPAHARLHDDRSPYKLLNMKDLQELRIRIWRGATVEQGYLPRGCADCRRGCAN